MGEYTTRTNTNPICSSLCVVVSYIQLLLLLLANMDVDCFLPVKVCVKEILLNAYELLPKRERKRGAERWRLWEKQLWRRDGKIGVNKRD